jgi:SAM-dependent methyltransferase
MTDSKEYFNYLRQRSGLGLLYRKYWLYPKLSKILHGRALDIGCGVGDMLAYRANTVGVDINPKTVDWCKAQGLNVHLMEQDQLPFDEQSFDSVILDNVLEHIESPSPLLLEIHRVLAEQGILIIGVPGILGYSTDPDHKVFYTKENLLETVTSYGFLAEDLFAMPLNFDWLDSKMSQYCIYAVFEKGNL